MSWAKFWTIAIAVLSGITPAVAQQRTVLKPSPDLVSVDINRLIVSLKAAKASQNQINSAEAMYSRAKAAGLATDLSSSMQSFIVASSNNDRKAIDDLMGKMTPYELGEAAYSIQNYGIAQRYWLPLAQAGDVAAEQNVGLVYFNGANGATQSDAEALKWYRSAAIQGSEVAQENLAILYQEGRGVPANPVQAFVWWSLAAQQAVTDGHNATSVSLINRRDMFAEQLSPEAKDQALKLVEQCSASHYKDCE